MSVSFIHASHAPLKNTPPAKGQFPRPSAVSACFAFESGPILGDTPGESYQKRTAASASSELRLLTLQAQPLATYLLRCTNLDDAAYLPHVRSDMRDIFEEIFANEPLEPMEAARRAMRPALRRRFYDRAMAERNSEGFAILLDDKPVRTPARRKLAAPSAALAEALVGEWHAQENVIDPATMPLTRLANTIIDGVAQTPLPVAEEVTQYLRSDLLFYRAEGPRGLVERQEQQWDPVLAWARDALGARFILATGVMFVDQPQEAVARAKAVIPSDAWRLGAVSSITTLTARPCLRSRCCADG